jgi:hypothetical protein
MKNDDIVTLTLHILFQIVFSIVFRSGMQIFFTVKCDITNLVKPQPVDCKDVYNGGETTTGVYTIYPWGDSDPPVTVYCDMVTSGGGWTVS